MLEIKGWVFGFYWVVDIVGVVVGFLLGVVLLGWV